MNNNQISSISISGEITLNLHSLNNEGGEGNQIITRQLTIVDKHGTEHTVNGISGDMFKHIHAFYLVNQITTNKNDICEGCKIFDPNRISIDSKFLNLLKGTDPEEFDEADRSSYIELQDKLNELEESSKESKDIKVEMNKIAKKYIILKIDDEEDKRKYEEAVRLLEGDLKKIPKNDSEKKKSKQEKEKEKKEIEKKYSLNFSNAEKIDKMLEICSVDDIHGNLITASKNNLSRKSVIEFGWSVGLPGKNNTESYVHTKLVPDAGDKNSSDSNIGQNIFHRPANHGIYAFVCSIDVYRIGYNDISREYSINDSKRKDRYKSLIQSLLNSFINPRGAMTSTQKPHITHFEGVVTLSNKTIPAPTISPLNEEYKKEIEKITENLNKIENDTINFRSFHGMGELTEIFSDLMNYEPYKLG